MNIEEKIAKKENRRKGLKKLGIVLIGLLVVIGIILAVYYFIVQNGKNPNKQEANRNQQGNQNVNIEQQTPIQDQIKGIEIGESKIQYKEYTYIYDNKNNAGIKIYRQKNGEELQEVINLSSSWSGGEVIIYKDKIYVMLEHKVRTFNLDGSAEEVMIDGYSSLKYDYDKEMIYYIYNDDSTQKEKVVIQKLTGEKIKEIPIKGESYMELQEVDEENIYMTETIYNEEETYDAVNTVNIYSLNQEDGVLKKLKTEEVIQGSTSGIYQFKVGGDYLYYTVGAQQGSLIVFYGRICRIKKDGTGYEEVKGLGGERGVVPEMLIKNDYLYIEGCRVNLKTNEISEDKYQNGDKIDDENYVYTASKSDQSTFIIAKYKAGTNYEGIQTIFSKETEEVIDVEQASIEIQGDDIYVSFDYLDYNTENWRPVVTKSETYRIKKDGSSSEKVE